MSRFAPEGSSSVRNILKIKLPADGVTIESLRTGEQVLISGTIYAARDAAHRRIIDTLDKGNAPPFPIKGQAIYYMGPAPAKAGQVVGSAGPTTSGRMDAYTPRLLAEGLKVMIGKGERSKAVRQAIINYGALYLAAIGGAGVIMAKSVKTCEIIAYPELGTEAVFRLDVEDFPAIVINDAHGGDLYQEGRARYRQKAK